MPITAKADAAIEKTIDLEKGYVNNPNDKGGATNWGITEAVARAYGYKGDMKDLPRATAKQIYVSQYWTKPGFEAVSVLSPDIAWEMFDAGVLSGQGMPIKWLQRSLNVLNGSHTDKPLFAQLVADGGMGPVTINALSLFLKARGKDGVTVILRLLNSLQAEYMVSITESRVQNEAFIYGWILNRVTI